MYLWYIVLHIRKKGGIRKHMALLTCGKKMQEYLKISTSFVYLSPCVQPEKNSGKMAKCSENDSKVY
jgi:hypothetical protein